MQDPRSTVIQVADFLGKDLDEEAIDRVVQYSHVDSMKKIFKSSDKSTDQPDADSSKLGAPGIIRKGIAS